MGEVGSGREEAAAVRRTAASISDPEQGHRLAVVFFAGVLTLCAGVGLWAATPLPEPILAVPPIVLVVAFAATEVTALHVESRRDSHSISMAAFPLLIGLLAVGPLMLVTARLVGAGFALDLF